MNYFEDIHKFISDFRERLILKESVFRATSSMFNIDDVERELSVSLPFWFKDFYRSYGCIESATARLLWSPSQLIEYNLDLRGDPSTQGFFPGNLGIVIGELAGAGGPFLLGEPPNELKIWFASAGDEFLDIAEFAADLVGIDDQIYGHRYMSPLLNIWQGSVQAEL